MDSRDYYVIMGLLLGLAVTGILQSAVLRRHDDDIRYLMDNAFTRETEASS